MGFLYSAAALLLLRGASALPLSRHETARDNRVSNRVIRHEHAVEIGADGPVLDHDSQSKPMDKSGHLSYVADAEGHVLSMTSFWNSSAFLQRNVPGKLGSKFQGFCVDEKGDGIPSSYTVVNDENTCWKVCDDNPGLEACAYHYDTNRCVQYSTKATRANGFDGFFCRMKIPEPAPAWKKHPCAQSCPDDVVPTCSMYKNFVAAGGCAQYCSDAVKAKYAQFVCGRKPHCASTCPEDKEPDCAAMKGFTNTGGCASSCPEAMKLEFVSELCGRQKPQCAKTCPDGAVPTCSTFKAFTSPQGCAESCTDAVKTHFAAFVCGRKPLCAANCPEDVTPTCAMYDDFVGKGGCAETCSDENKLQFKTELCGLQKPACTKSCPDDAVPTCSVFHSFVKEGGCAESCSEAEKKHYAPYVCGRIPLCAAGCPQDADPTCSMYESFVAEGGCAATCTAEQKHEFKHEVCNTDKMNGWSDSAHEDVKRTYGKKPECAAACPDSLFPTCQMYKEFTGQGGWDVSPHYGCAGGCDPATKEHMVKTACGGHENTWLGAAERHNSLPNNIEEAEKEVEKIDLIVTGAEREAGLPDTVHTTPIPEQKLEEEEEKAEMKQRAMIALGLACVCCCWSCLCIKFHNWALGYKKSKGDEAEALVEGEQEQ